jgi:hypothetical protein
MNTQTMDEISISLHPSWTRCVSPSLHMGRYIANQKSLGRVGVAPSLDTGRDIETGKALTVGAGRTLFDHSLQLHSGLTC